jgi:hypothetical protein
MVRFIALFLFIQSGSHIIKTLSSGNGMAQQLTKGSGEDWKNNEKRKRLESAASRQGHP